MSSNIYVMHRQVSRSQLRFRAWPGACSGSQFARRFLCFYLFFPLFFPAMIGTVQAQSALKYQEPPKAIVELVDVRPTPIVDVSPGDQTGKRWLLIEAISGLPSIADLAQPEMRLAGSRFIPRRTVQPWALLDGPELRRTARRRREANCGSPPENENPHHRGREWVDPLCGLGSGWPPRFFHQRERRDWGCRVEPVDRGCSVGAGAAHAWLGIEWDFFPPLRVVRGQPARDLHCGTEGEGARARAQRSAGRSRDPGESRADYARADV